MFDQPIRDPNEYVMSEEQREYNRLALAKSRAKKKGLPIPESAPARKMERKATNKGIVNRVTEYGALFNRLNEERVNAGLAPLKTAMEVLIDAMQSDEIELRDKARIAEKLATFESSRAPVISIEHVQNIVREEEVDADGAMAEFLDSLKKV